MFEMKISFGGSNRKNKRCRELLRERFGNNYYPFDMPISLGSKRRKTWIPDTPENRRWIKETPDFSISRDRPNTRSDTRLPSPLAVAFGGIMIGTRNRSKTKIDEIYAMLQTENTDRLDAIQEMAEKREILFAGIGRKIRLRRTSPTELELNIADLLDLPTSRPIGEREASV